jgi:putative endopeptidase
VAGKVKSVIVSQPSYLQGLDKIIAATPVGPGSRTSNSAC